MSRRINLLKYLVHILGFFSIIQWLKFDLFFKEYVTYLIWIVDISIIYILYRERTKSKTPKSLALWISLVVVWCICGSFRCDDYWDWKSFIVNIMAYNVCIASLVFGNPDKFSYVLSFWFKYAWKYIFFLIPFISEDGVTKSLCPYMFLALLFPIITNKYKYHVLIVLILYLTLGIGARMDNIKFLFCILIGIMSQSKNLICNFKALAKKMRICFLIGPFIFFILAATGIFNVFNFKEYINLDENAYEESMIADTRTMLYEEVFESVSSHGRVLYGETPAKGYESAWFARNFDLSDIMGINHYGWRGNTESSVLNVFMHFGLIGIIVYFFVFSTASYYAIYKSNNKYLPILGAFVAFRFLVGWVEDFTRFDLNMLVLWMMIGMCHSSQFRDMSNEEFELWIQNKLLV